MIAPIRNAPTLSTPIVLLLLMMIPAGCGSGADEIQRYALMGTVTFQGKSVPYGTISLVPDSSQGNAGPGSMGIIENGSFQIPAQQGIIGGPYLVTINGQASAPQASGESTMNGKSLFTDFQTSVNLPAETTTQTFDVSAQKDIVPVKKSRGE